MKLFAVVTSIQEPTESLRRLNIVMKELNSTLLVIGDRKSPNNFTLEGCKFIGIERQSTLGLEAATKIPENSYSRKMIGYLQALQSGADRIFETDDDNIPLENFYDIQDFPKVCRVINSTDTWINTYEYFTTVKIWPRGFPLENITGTDFKNSIATSSLKFEACVVQYLVDNDPDVDAIYRMTQSEKFPITFEPGKTFMVPGDSYTPFNSQSTDWPIEFVELMYLPSTCSFRMTDIWRSFIAQRIGREIGFHLIFRSPIMMQSRNEHVLHSDFSEEIEGYLNYNSVVSILNKTECLPGIDNIAQNLIRCYNALIHFGIFHETELEILDAYIRDIHQIRGTP